MEVRKDNTTEDAADVTDSATATEAAERLAELKRSYFTAGLIISDRRLLAANFFGGRFSLCAVYLVQTCATDPKWTLAASTVKHYVNFQHYWGA